jgi:hypothetical protein
LATWNVDKANILTKYIKDAATRHKDGKFTLEQAIAYLVVQAINSGIHLKNREAKAMLDAWIQFD